MIDLKHAVYGILHNIMVEAVVVALISLVYVLTRGLDRVFHTKLKRGLINQIHRITMDDLSGLRRAQIRYVFRSAYGLKMIKIQLAGGSYWMSIPCIVEGLDKRTNRPVKFLGKIINDRSALMHRYMTVLRNLGVMAEGASLEFDDYNGAIDMVEFERNALMLLRNRHVSVPEVFGTHRLNHDDYILVMQFIEGQPLSKVELTDGVIDQIFSTLRTMHDTGVFHGDVKLDNFIYSNGRLYVVDCLKIDRREPWKAQGFDLICAICALAQRVPVDRIMRQAELYHTPEELHRAGRLLGVALNKVDLDIPPDRIKAIEVALNVEKVTVPAP